MPLVPLGELLTHAKINRYAVGYFESWDSYSFEGVLEAAESQDSPVIVGFGATMLDDSWLNHRGIEFLGASGRRLLDGCSVPVSFLLNETHTLEQAIVGVDSGFNFVMIDSHRWPVEEAKEAVAKLVSIAHPSNVAVEAEFGSMPDYIAGRVEDSGSYMTDPKEAVEFVSHTGIDCLAVAIGNVHLMTSGTPKIDLDRLKKLNNLIDIPLAIHGGTGFPPSLVTSAIENGVVKFNVGTRLKANFLREVVNTAKSWSGNESVHDLVGSHKQTDFLSSGKNAIVETVQDFMKLYGSAGQATKMKKREVK